MYATIHTDHVAASYLCRWAGRITGAVLFAVWLAYFVVETTRPLFTLRMATMTWVQGALLAVVFAGYAAGWRWERIGAIMVLVAAAVFFALHVVAMQGLPSVSVAWFAVPGVLYLAASYFDHRPACIAAD
jgi:hypothetical protein